MGKFWKSQRNYLATENGVKQATKAVSYVIPFTMFHSQATSKSQIHNLLLQTMQLLLAAVLLYAWATNWKI